MDTNNLVNEDFQAELQAINDNAESEADGKVGILKAPQTQQQQNQAVTDISTTALFGTNVLDGRLPTLTQSFIIEKSNQDKLVEMGQVAQEMYMTKKVSRSQIIALEAIARELIPAQQDSSEERAVIVSDNEVNMFTEEASVVEAETAINNTQATVDRIIGDLRNSAIALAEKMVETAEKDRVERKEKIYKSISAFNNSIIKFLQETENQTLESADLKFKRDLRWGDLMSINLTAICSKMDSATYEEMISSFDGTYAETFIKDLEEFLKTSNNSFSVLRNFILGTSAVIRNNADADNNIARAQDNEPEKERVYHTLTVGDLFSSFGDFRFTTFYSNLDECIETQITAAKSARQLLNGKTDVKEIMALTYELHNQQKNIMDCSSNMAVLNHVQFMIIKFLSNF